MGPSLAQTCPKFLQLPVLESPVSPTTAHESPPRRDRGPGASRGVRLGRVLCPGHTAYLRARHGGPLCRDTRVLPQGLLSNG